SDLYGVGAIRHGTLDGGVLRVVAERISRTRLTFWPNRYIHSVDHRIRHPQIDRVIPLLCWRHSGLEGLPRRQLNNGGGTKIGGVRIIKRGIANELSTRIKGQGILVQLLESKKFVRTWGKLGETKPSVRSGRAISYGVPLFPP